MIFLQSFTQCSVFSVACSAVSSSVFFLVVLVEWSDDDSSSVACGWLTDSWLADSEAFSVGCTLDSSSSFVDFPTFNSEASSGLRASSSASYDNFFYDPWAYDAA